MKVPRFIFLVLGVAAAGGMLAACAGIGSPIGAPVSWSSSAAQVRGLSSSETVLYSFTGGNDGGNAAMGLVLDRRGDLYGTTVVGGTSSCGTVFKLTPKAGPPWKERVLFDFDCFATGKNPHGGVVFDRRGQLVGTTVAGGSGGSCVGDGCGTVFAITRNGENVLHSFTGGNDGFGPGSAVVTDKAGDIFGTAPDGGADGDGVVFEVAHGGHEKVLHPFTGGRDGGTGSLGALLRDEKTGALYGVTETGGARGAGTVYKLTPSSGKWKLTVLYTFKGSPDAASPYGGVIADDSGNLFGTTYYGGSAGTGTVYELQARAGGKYRERVLYSFKGGNDGSYPTSTLAFGPSGNLYGTTSMGGGTCDCGTIFSVNAASGGEQVLHSFGGTRDGENPYYGLTLGNDGTFYGTTVAGGRFGQGTVFEFTP